MARKARKAGNGSGRKICEVCGKACVLEEHHIEGRKVRNPHEKNNTTQICPNCHSLHHAGKIQILGRKMTTDGAKLFWIDADGDLQEGRRE